MKKFFMTLVLVLVALVAMADTGVYTVKYVHIGRADRGTEVIFEESKSLYAAKSEVWIYRFFNSLRAGDIVQVEEHNNQIVALRKVGHTTPSGMTNGVIIDGANNYGGYGYYGGYGSASIETKNVGVGYDPYSGIHVRYKDNYINLPIRLKSKKFNSNNIVETVQNTTVTANPTVKVVSVDELAKSGNNVKKNVVTTSTTRSKTNTTRTASAVYTASGVVMF